VKRMVLVQKLQKRRILHPKCRIDGNVPAEWIIKFKFGWALVLCDEHYKELKDMVEED
jgi:hypothetical protein